MGVDKIIYSESLCHLDCNALANICHAGSGACATPPPPCLSRAVHQCIDVNLPSLRNHAKPSKKNMLHVYGPYSMVPLAGFIEHICSTTMAWTFKPELPN
jgi:hypothetical protein